MNIIALLEAPKDEFALQQLGKAIMAYIEDCLANGKTEQSKNGHTVIPRTVLGKVLPKGSWGDLYTVFAKTDLMAIFAVNPYTNTSPFPKRGEYYGGLNGLSIYGVIDDRGQMYDKDEILSTIIHELRHRLDDSRSKKKAFTNKKERVAYWSQPSEIGARFSQAIADIIGPLKDSFDAGNVMSAAEFVKLFEQVAVKYKLMDVFKHDAGSATDIFLNFAKNGIFGRSMPVDALHNVVQGMGAIADGQPVGPMDDKSYRRLISRVVLVYNTAIAQWSKQKTQTNKTARK